MITQLLGKHGLVARLIAYENISLNCINSLDVSETVVACMSYLDLGGSAAHLRYHAAIEATASVGNTNSRRHVAVEVAVLSNVALQTFMGADYFSLSLGQSMASWVHAI